MAAVTKNSKSDEIKFLKTTENIWLNFGMELPKHKYSKLEKRKNIAEFCHNDLLSVYKKSVILLKFLLSNNNIFKHLQTTSSLESLNQLLLNFT